MNREMLHNEGFRRFKTSPNAYLARQNGEQPISQWDWTTLIWAVDKINPIASDERLTTPTMQKYYLRGSGRYLTSKYKKVTTFYKLNEPLIKRLTVSDVNEIVELQKPQNRKHRNEQVDTEVEKILSMISIILIVDMFDTEEEAVGYCIKSGGLDDIYVQALEKLKQQDADIMEIYSHLFCNDFTRECVYFFYKDIDAYAKLMYANKYFSRKGKSFIKLERWLNATRSRDNRYSDNQGH